MCKCNEQGNPCSVKCFEDEPKPHKHAVVIKAWADGAKIQAHNHYKMWVDVPFPTWDLNTDYRIEPVPKPDRTHISRVALINTGSGDQTHLCNLYDTHLGGKVEYTFDGETGKLKSVCLINS